MTPKLSTLTEQDKIRLAAELDGIEIKPPTDVSQTWDKYVDGKYCGSLLPRQFQETLKPYPTSYDATIPLIQKQTQQTQDKMGEIMCRMDAFKYKWFWCGTPSQLLDALLVATRKAEL